MSVKKKQADHVIPRYLGIEAAAIYMGISPAYVRKLKDNGELKYFKLGGRVLFDTKDIDDYMAKMKSRKLTKAEITDEVDIDSEMETIYGV